MRDTSCISMCDSRSFVVDVWTWHLVLVLDRFYHVFTCWPSLRAPCAFISLSFMSFKLVFPLFCCVVINHQKGGDYKHLGPQGKVSVIVDNYLLI